MKIDNRDIVTMREKYPTLKIMNMKKNIFFTGEFTWIIFIMMFG